MEAADTVPVRQYLTFFLEKEEYAIGILWAREIIEYGNITRVPGTPSCIRGVVNLRGSVLPVVDLSVKFGFPPIERTKQTCIIVVETEMEGQKVLIGLMTDAVNQVIEVSDEQIQPPPAFGTRIQLEYLRGLCDVGEGFVLILNPDELLTADELVATAALHDSLNKLQAASETPGKMSAIAE